ncbi:hypothetical protein QW180_31580 [Vibrio sinaloensis]|nr:hypothetical protein [Vibrio sinaloensis]
MRGNDFKANLLTTHSPEEYIKAVGVIFFGEQGKKYRGTTMDKFSLNERGHSGGDPTLESFDFSECELNSNLNRFCELFTNAPKF